MPFGYIYADNPNADYANSQPLLAREEVAQIVRRELERQNHYQNNHRNVICYHCGRNGHFSSVCRRRRYDNVNSNNKISSQNIRRYRQNGNLGSARPPALLTNSELTNESFPGHDYSVNKPSNRVDVYNFATKVRPEPQGQKQIESNARESVVPNRHMENSSEELTKIVLKDSSVRP